MCTPNLISSDLPSGFLGAAFKGVEAVQNVSSTILNYKTNKDIYAYRTQIALNNAKVAQDEAMRQKQLGIEKSRLEKISGLQEVNKLKAQNSASGLDAMSQTNTLNYQDALNLSKINANSTKKEYDSQADSYFDQAHSYLNQAQTYQKQYNQSLFDYSLNALGKLGRVSNDWYGNRKELS